MHLSIAMHICTFLPVAKGNDPTAVLYILKIANTASVGDYAMQSDNNNNNLRL